MKKVLSILILLILIWLPLNINIRTATGTNLKGLDKALKFIVWPSQHQQQLDFYFHSITLGNRFNGGMLIAQDGKIIYRKVHGFTDFKTKDSLDIHAQFQLASVSKQFTSVAILKLKDEGKLNLDDSVARYLPGFPYPGITIRHLLSHQSGLTDYHHITPTDTFFYLTNDSLLSAINNKQLVEAYARPGKRFDYCNTNYALLASIVEKISKQKFPEYMQQQIFEPLGMANTFVYVPGLVTNSQKKMTLGHNPNNTHLDPVSADGVYGDKNIYSTLNDLFLWNEALNNNLIVSEQSISEAWTPQNNRSRTLRNYGLGWRLNMANNHKMVYHSGWWRGYNTILVNIPEHKMTIVILANKRTRSFFSNYYSIINTLLPGYFPTHEAPEEGILQSPEMEMAPHELNMTDSLFSILQ